MSLAQGINRSMPPPSRCTVYVSNLPFSLTNTDISKIFEKFGEVVR